MGRPKTSVGEEADYARVGAGSWWAAFHFWGGHVAAAR